MSIRCLDCGATWTGRRMEHCPVEGCHQTFSGAEAGDRHRVGLHGVSDGPDRRRCLTPEQMLAYPSRRSGKGFWQADGGVWHFGTRRDPLSISGWDPVAHGPATWGGAQ